MNRYIESIKTAIIEINKALDTLSTKDISSTGISARQIVNMGLEHIVKTVEALSREMKSPESSDLARASAEQAKGMSPQTVQIQQEMTSMAGGDVSGVGGGIDLGSEDPLEEEEEEEEEEEDPFDEEDTPIKENVLPIRKAIRETLYNLYEKSGKIGLEELLEEFGEESAPIANTKKVDTGVNLANELFPQIKTLIQKQYVMLKTNEAQRQAFTKQLMKALEVGVNQLQIDFEVAMAGGATAMQTDIGDKSKEDSFNAAVDVPGIDPTGKSFAMQVYKTTFPKISSALNGDPPQFGLTDPSDRRSFVKTLVDEIKELCSSLEKYMAQEDKSMPAAPAETLAPKEPLNTNANSNFLMP